MKDTRVEKILSHLHNTVGPGCENYLEYYHCQPAPREDLENVHSTEYVSNLYSKGLDEEIIHTYELRDALGQWHRYNPAAATRPFSELFHTILCQVETTEHTCRLALEKGWSFFLGGGAHHAMRDHGSGFCLLNDIVIAIKKMQAEKKAGLIWVIDTDAHKGDGTAALTDGDPDIRTLSIHMARGWPLDEPSNPERALCLIPSDIDIPVETGEENQYLTQLAAGLDALGQWGQPDLAVIVAGSDPFEEDELPSTSLLKLDLQTMLEREHLVFNFLESRNIPQAWLMAGGYGENAWKVPGMFLENLLKKVQP